MGNTLCFTTSALKTASAILRHPSSHLAYVPACTQKTHVAGDASRTWWVYSIEIWDFLCRMSVPGQHWHHVACHSPNASKTDERCANRKSSTYLLDLVEAVTGNKLSSRQNGTVDNVVGFSW
jgi:hypothetical protein